VVAQVGIGLLRQHLRQTDRVHGIVTKGGDAQNVVPAHTEAQYMVRASTLDELQEVRDKVMRCFEAGALATGATLDVASEYPAYRAAIEGALAMAWTAIDMAADEGLRARLVGAGGRRRDDGRPPGRRPGAPPGRPGGPGTVPGPAAPGSWARRGGAAPGRPLQ